MNFADEANLAPLSEEESCTLRRLVEAFPDMYKSWKAEFHLVANQADLVCQTGLDEIKARAHCEDVKAVANIDGLSAFAIVRAIEARAERDYETIRTLKKQRAVARMAALRVVQAKAALKLGSKNFIAHYIAYGVQPRRAAKRAKCDEVEVYPPSHRV